MSADRVPFAPGLHRFAVFTSAATLFLLLAGGLVTSTGSGLAVPDWPLSYGMVFPPMVGGIFYEHGHRIVASLVGLLTVILAVWAWRKDVRTWVGVLGLAALAAVIVEGLLGGLAVLFLLPTSVSVTHACLAQTFFCLIVVLAIVTSRSWMTPGSALTEAARVPVRWVAVFAAGVVYLQLVLGALVRHTESGLAIPDFPLSFGRVIPPFGELTSDPSARIRSTSRRSSSAS